MGEEETFEKYIASVCLGGGWEVVFWGIFRLLVFSLGGGVVFQSHQIRNSVWILHTKGWLAWLLSEFSSASWTILCIQTKTSREMHLSRKKKKKSSSLFIIRSTFQESQTFYLPFKYEHHISSWLRGIVRVWSWGAQSALPGNKVSCYWARLQIFRPDPSVEFFPDRERCKRRKVHVKEPPAVD